MVGAPDGHLPPVCLARKHGSTLTPAKLGISRRDLLGRADLWRGVTFSLATLETKCRAGKSQLSAVMAHWLVS